MVAVSASLIVLLTAVTWVEGAWPESIGRSHAEMIQTPYSRLVSNTTGASGGVRREHGVHKWSLSAPNSDVCVQLLTLLISKPGFVAEYFARSHSDAGPPQGC